MAEGFLTKTSAKFTLFIDNHPFVFAVSRLVTLDCAHDFLFSLLPCRRTSSKILCLDIRSDGGKMAWMRTQSWQKGARLTFGRPSQHMLVKSGLHKTNFQNNTEQDSEEVFTRLTHSDRHVEREKREEKGGQQSTTCKSHDTKRTEHLGISLDLS